jgi:hypothetical protein
MRPLRPAYRPLALSLAFLMFFTSAGFAVDMHYCQGQLKSFNFFGKAKNCHEMEQKVVSCPHHGTMVVPTAGCEEGKKGCCQNEVQYFQSDQDKNFQTADLVAGKQGPQPALPSVPLFPHLIQQTGNKVTFACYKPPLREKNIPVLFQSFLL